MSEDDETATERSTPPIPPPAADARTIPLEADDAGDTPEVIGICGSQCGTARIFCELGRGHEEREHPDYTTNIHGEAVHLAHDVRWPVDAAAAEVAERARSRQLLEDARRLEREAKG